jgi:DNA-binding response OmpR family regulator
MNRLDERQLTAPLVSETQPSIGQRGIVLIVTSDRNLCDVASRVLEGEGYAVVTAPHAGHAVLAALTLNRIDVLIAELTLDDMAGQRLAASLRRYHPQLRNLFVAQAATPRQDGVLVRPFTRDELLVGLNAAPATAVSPAS